MNRELGAFLRARRGEAAPQDVGLPTWPRRRVGGLRREEPAESAGISSLIGELSVRSEHFRLLWAGRVVKERTHGVKRFRHPVVGELALRYETFEVAGGGQRLSLLHPEPDGVSEESLRLPASWEA
ncbi:hypothetical protein [Nonomuraea sp. NPDC049480]|uniref:MmyB family transcriptional regulator n=1 Tax=Nonomuraea sp. NPDC049480 TaxID=3364353 RepID=UPI0037939D55